MENTEKNWLTVKEFAELAGVSIQSVYKRINKPDNPIQRYLNVVDGVKLIDRKAYDILYHNDKKQQDIVLNQTETGVPFSGGTDRILNLLEAQLSEQQRQLTTKDEQIAALNEQIKSLLARLEDSSRIIDQQQQLTAFSAKALVETEEPKRGWKRFFGRD